MNTKNMKTSLVINGVILVMVTLGIIFMITGFKFMSNTEVLSSTGISLLKYYTVDSNILVGISSLLLIVYECLFLRKRIRKIPRFVYAIKYIATVAVTLTFLVTLFYLGPMFGQNFLFLYQNSNLFFHLLVPIFSFISFAFFEKSDFSFRYTFYGTSTMIIYGLYYAVNVFIHLNDGKVALEYDWYGFVKDGLASIFIVFPTMLLITYLISFIIWKMNDMKELKKVF